MLILSHLQQAEKIMNLKLKLSAPQALKKNHIHEIHGDLRQDDYFWLRDDHRQNQQVIDYLEQENAFTEQEMSPLAPLQTELYDEMVARQEPELESVPYFKQGFWYTVRFAEGKDYMVYSRRKESMAASEQILVDCNERAQGLSYYQLGDVTLSSNSMLMAFSEDVVGRRQYTLGFKNLETGEILNDLIEDVSDVVWANDNQTVFYVKQHPETLLPYQVYRHRLGDRIKDDVLVYEELDDTFYVSLDKTRSEQYLVIAIDSTTTSECLVLDADQPMGEFVSFLPRLRGHEYSIDHFQEQFYIRTNNSGKNFALKTSTLLINHNADAWVTIIEARNDVLLEGYELMKEWLIVEERQDGLPLLRQINHQTGESKTLTFSDPVYTVFSHFNPEANTAKFRYQYTSFTTPSSVYELDLNSGETILLKQSQVMGEFDSHDYKSERVWVTARDGVQVPVSLVYSKKLFNHENPILIYAYGSYGHSLDIGFDSSNLSLLDRGFVYAIAHIRGGEELGRSWYEEGKLLKKQNTFNDFIDVTKSLISTGYGSEEKVFAMGGSAGGLLMGAIINQAPELYKGVVAVVPFVDIVSTMLDESIPLTTGEYDEWGNPNEKNYYHYMLSYSPYDQVKAVDYPNMLVTTGLHDSQVQYWEPAKWVAKLRALKTDHNQLLLYTDMEAGHGGKSGRFKHFEDTAREFAFILSLVK
ncbi:oligopeptidase B, Serine peptidase, MEROPS family S09A [Psychromonas ingrahamii 37]|uniref:Oligopeptidase B, Serine peptidase, MEROPS family S09A n=2 Tax=Psychromonas ingrahamii TaxID=357794 RepID=A1SSM1_PSYIN|nr:oligopeptidase B, Serine peptidase, MEROPS family S09A [Psychromonas ingrahamii 37]